jgi:hypothetical protein
VSAPNPVPAVEGRLGVDRARPRRALRPGASVLVRPLDVLGRVEEAHRGLYLVTPTSTYSSGSPRWWCRADLELT